MTARLTKAGSVEVGSGAATSSISPTPFSGTYGGMKGQYIILASELTAAGLAAGPITSLSLNFAAASTSTYAGLSIQMAHTSLAAFPTTLSLEGGLTTVYAPTDLVAPAAGLKAFDFTTPFTWNGTSNIIVSTNWSSGLTTSTAATLKTVTTTFNSAQIHKRDSYTPADLLALTGTQAAGSSTVGTTRPQFTFAGLASVPMTSTVWSDGTSTIGTTNPFTVSPSVPTTYSATLMVGTCAVTPNPTLLVTPVAAPTAPTATNRTTCGGIVPTASVASTSGATTPTFNWYAATTGVTALQSSTSTTYTTPISATTTFYVSELNASGCESPRTAVVATVFGLSITPSVASFCGVGGSSVLTASSANNNFTYAWTKLTPSATLSAASGATTNVTLTETSDFQLVATDAVAGCSVTSYTSIGVYAFPSTTMTATPSAICLGNSTTLNSGLSAGNFSYAAITSAPRTAPASAVNLVTAGAAVAPLTGGTLDDGGWGAVPIGFNFNFFGTTYNSINVGTNGTLQFGAFNINDGATVPRGLKDYEFVTLPSTTEPFNVIAVCANDNDLSTSGTTNGTIRYWTTGYAPNRVFIVEYLNARTWNVTTTSTAQAHFYETTGLVEIHVIGSTSVKNKLVGLQNGDGTIGALALATTAVISTPVSFRFTPPSNYTTTWTPTTTLTAPTSGSNVVTVVAKPTTLGTTTYSLVFTNPVTGCSNSGKPATIDVTVNPTTTAVAVASSDWNTTTTWGCGAVPTTTANVTIPTGMTVTLDINNPTINSLTFSGGGKLKLGANSLNVTGALTGDATAGYVVTDGTGKLKRPIAASATAMFPIGATITTYDPVVATPTTATTFGANVSNTINPAHIIAPAGVALVGSREWDLSSSTPSATVLAFTPSDTRTAPTAGVKIGQWNSATTTWQESAATYATGTWTATTSLFLPTILTEANTIIPVEFQSISASAKGKINVIDWSTASEKNMKEFAVERSINNKIWEVIGTKAATGGTAPAYYSFDDNTPTLLTYYRIRSIETDRKDQISKVVAVKREGGKLVLISVAPVPTTEGVTIDFSAGKTNKVTVIITDIVGRIVESKTFGTVEGANSLRLNLSNRTQGTYIMTLNDGETVATQRIVKQ